MQTTTRRLTQTGRVVRSIGTDQSLMAKAGVLATAPQPEDTEWTMATLAAHLHYGPVGSKRKSWPWMRLAFDENVGHYRNLTRAGCGRILQGRDTPRGVLMIVAVRMKGDHQRMMTTIQSPELEESTKRKKARTIRSRGKRASFIGGSGNPLIDTGALRASHDWRVE